MICSRWLAFVLILAASPLLFQARADDWPQWRGPARTGHITSGAPMLTSLPPDPKLIWRLNVGEGFASPVLAGGKLFYFDNQGGKETLHALQAKDATRLWSTPVDDTFQDEQGPPGPRCTPIVDGDLVYAQSGKGELACLSVSDGRRIWRVNFTNDFGAAFLGEDSKVPGAAEHGYTASPVISGERLVACVGGTNGAGIVCFAKRTGQILWKSQNDLAAYAAPMITELAGATQIVCFTVEGLIGLDLLKGNLLWRIPLKTSYGRNCTTPLIVNDWVVAGSYRAGLIGVKVSAAEKGFKAEQRWVNQKAAMNFSSPVAVREHLYGLGPSKNLICADVETGNILWSKEGYFGGSDSAYAAMIVMGKTILISTDGGQLILIEADARQCKELGRAQVCSRNWCSPAYVDGRLYIRDGLRGPGNLSCLELTH